jgi:integrase
MGSVYQRGDSSFWWVVYTDARGKRQFVSSKSSDRAFAEKLLASLERDVAAMKAAGVKESGPLLLGQFAETWLARRRKKQIASADGEADRLAHVTPRLGKMPLAEVKRTDVVALVTYLQNEAMTNPGNRRPVVRLSARTVRHVYFVLKQMLDDAVIDGLILANPCTLKAKRGELPRKRDKNPAWRATAVYTRGEAEQLLSDTRIPEYRRVLFAIQVLGGLRINEVTPRRWEDYDDASEPLGRLRVVSSYVLKGRREKAGTKTGNVREVPVHPTLAKVLAAWKIGGWERHQGRAPKPGDLIVPAPSGGILNSNSSLLRLGEDQTLLGLRKRRQHDARRTFISLARAGGASKDLLRWVTHGPEGDVIDDYTTPPWHALCEQVGFLRLSLLAGEVIPLRKLETV